MSRNSLFPTQSTQAQQIKSLPSSILVAEAAIATLVLSVFVSSSPKLFSTHAPESRPATAINPNTPKPQLFSIQLPIGTSTPIQVKTAEQVH